MNERDYINATDLRALDCAWDCLRHVNAASQPAIKEKEFERVMRLISKWRNAIENEVCE